MISPYSVRLMVDREDHSGHMAGLLYFISTLGSALGTLGTSFYFVLWYEVNQILWGAVVSLVLAGLVVLFFENIMRTNTIVRNRGYVNK